MVAPFLILISIFYPFNLVQRAAYLESDQEMEASHSVAATAGDTEVSFLLLVIYQYEENYDQIFYMSARF